MNYAWLKGKAAFRAGAQVSDNPYDKEKCYRAWCDWNLGFEEARRGF